MTGLKDATLNCSSKEERREKREERDKHDRDDRVEGGNGSVPEGRYGTEKETHRLSPAMAARRTQRFNPDDRREYKQDRRQKREIPSQPDAKARSRNGGMAQRRAGP